MSSKYSSFNSSNTHCLMDSRVIDHTYTTFPTCHGKHSKHIFVELPIRGKNRIDSVGTMKVSDDLTIKDVHYVPKVKVNLLSINHLTQTLVMLTWIEYLAD